jgi:hypothetical protein
MKGSAAKSAERQYKTAERGSNSSLGAIFQPFRINDLEMVDQTIRRWKQIDQFLKSMQQLKESNGVCSRF